MKRTQIIDKGDYVSLDISRFPLEQSILDSIEKNMIRLSKEKKLDIEIVRQANIYYFVAGTEVKKNRNGERELHLLIGIGVEKVSVPASSVIRLYQQEMHSSRLPCSTTIVSFLCYSNFIRNRWILPRSIKSTRVHDDYSLLIPYHMMNTPEWRGSVRFRRELFKKSLQNEK